MKPEKLAVRNPSEKSRFWNVLYQEGCLLLSPRLYHVKEQKVDAKQWGLHELDHGEDGEKLRWSVNMISCLRKLGDARGVSHCVDTESSWYCQEQEIARNRTEIGWRVRLTQEIGWRGSKTAPKSQFGTLYFNNIIWSESLRQKIWIHHNTICCSISGDSHWKSFICCDASTTTRIWHSCCCGVVVLCKIIAVFFEPQIIQLRIIYLNCRGGRKV